MVRWSDKGDDSLWLLTAEELMQLPDGIVLSSISGGKYVKGKDKIDDDTRGGYLAYGVINPFNHELKDQFLLFRLATK